LGPTPLSCIVSELDTCSKLLRKSAVVVVLLETKAFRADLIAGLSMLRQ
jgi:hypothetical protein